MNHDDDFELPPEKNTEKKLIHFPRTLNNYNEEISNENLLVQDNTPEVSEQDLEDYTLKSLDKKVFISEMKDCDMYLKNLHKGFAKITTVNSLIDIVDTCLKVHTHRRKVITEIKAHKTEGDTFELDNNGNPIKTVS